MRVIYRFKAAFEIKKVRMSTISTENVWLPTKFTYLESSFSLLHCYSIFPFSLSPSPYPLALLFNSLDLTDFAIFHFEMHVCIIRSLIASLDLFSSFRSALSLIPLYPFISPLLCQLTLFSFEPGRTCYPLPFSLQLTAFHWVFV